MNNLLNILKLFDGYKTYIAAGLAGFVAVNHILHFVPDEVEQTIIAFATSLGLIGLRSAISKSDARVAELEVKKVAVDAEKKEEVK